MGELELERVQWKWNEDEVLRISEDFVFVVVVFGGKYADFPLDEPKKISLLFVFPSSPSSSLLSFPGIACFTPSALHPHPYILS